MDEDDLVVNDDGGDVRTARGSEVGREDMPEKIFGEEPEDRQNDRERDRKKAEDDAEGFPGLFPFAVSEVLRDHRHEGGVERSSGYKHPERIGDRERVVKRIYQAIL